MKKMLAITALLSSFQLFAGVCVIHYDRTACPGKEKESYAKCDGKKECDQKKKAETVEECQKISREACSNSRLTETKSKVIKAMFDGKPIKSVEGDEDFCAKYPNKSAEFDKCS